MTLPPLALSIASKLTANNRGYPESEYGSKCNDANLGIVMPACRTAIVGPVVGSPNNVILQFGLPNTFEPLKLKSRTPAFCLGG